MKKSIKFIGTWLLTIALLISWMSPMCVQAATTKVAKTQKQLEIHQAVTDEKIMNLATEVHENNNLKIRVPVLEEKVQHLEDELRKVAH